MLLKILLTMRNITLLVLFKSCWFGCSCCDSYVQETFILITNAGSVLTTNVFLKTCFCVVTHNAWRSFVLVAIAAFLLLVACDDCDFNKWIDRVMAQLLLFLFFLLMTTLIHNDALDEHDVKRRYASFIFKLLTFCEHGFNDKLASTS